MKIAPRFPRTLSELSTDKAAISRDDTQADVGAKREAARSDAALDTIGMALCT